MPATPELRESLARCRGAFLGAGLFSGLVMACSRYAISTRAVQ